MSQIKLAGTWTYASLYHGSVQTIEFGFLLDKVFWAFWEHFSVVVLTWSRAINCVFGDPHVSLGVPDSTHRLAFKRNTVSRLINVIFQELAPFLRGVFGCRDQLSASPRLSEV